RWPSQPGKMPLYVQRAFVVKMFGALALQILTCLALMLGLCEQFHFMAYVPNNGTSTSVFADVTPGTRGSLKDKGLFRRESLMVVLSFLKEGVNPRHR
ncbi:unnamed protein product, partial [Durusdinium trenchii]